MAFRSKVHGRLQFEQDGKTLGAFTVSTGGYTYLILAEFVVNKWKVFWSAKSTDGEDEDSLLVMQALTTNIYNFFADIPATENVNDDACEIARQL